MTDISCVELWCYRCVNWKKDWRYQRGKQTQKGQNDKQWPQNTTKTTKDESTEHEPHKNTRDERRWSGMVSSSCTTRDTRRITLVTNSTISHEWRQYGIVKRNISVIIFDDFNLVTRKIITHCCSHCWTLH